MNINDYVVMTSTYMINKMVGEKSENKFFIKSLRNSNNLYFIVEEFNENDICFYLKIPCTSKSEFFTAFNEMFGYLNKTEALSYVALGNDYKFGNTLSLVFKDRGEIVFSSKEEEDISIFLQIKNILDQGLKRKEEVLESCELIDGDFCDQSLRARKDAYLQKIML